MLIRLTLVFIKLNPRAQLPYLKKVFKSVGINSKCWASVFILLAHLLVLWVKHVKQVNRFHCVLMNSRKKNTFDHIGAYICAEISMGKTRVIKPEEIDQVKGKDTWWEHYDTIYLEHEEENRDEFCVKDPKQILKWVIIMDNDARSDRYGLNSEFSDTRCGFI